MTMNKALEILEHYTIVGYPMVPGQPQDLKSALAHLTAMAEDYERARPLLEAAKKALLCGPGPGEDLDITELDHDEVVVILMKTLAYKESFHD